MQSLLSLKVRKMATQQKMICYMRCINAFFNDITNIFVNITDFSCHFNQKDALRIPNECLCVILTYYFLLCSKTWGHAWQRNYCHYNCEMNLAYFLSLCLLNYFGLAEKVK